MKGGGKLPETIAWNAGCVQRDAEPFAQAPPFLPHSHAC